MTGDARRGCSSRATTHPPSYEVIAQTCDASGLSLPNPSTEETAKVYDVLEDSDSPSGVLSTVTRVVVEPMVAQRARVAIASSGTTPRANTDDEHPSSFASSFGAQ